MNINNAQAMLLKLVCSEFFFKDLSKAEDEAEFLQLSNSIVDLLADIEAKIINFTENTSSYLNSSDSLLDFVILAYLYQSDIDNLGELIRKSPQDANLVASQLGIVALTHCILEKRPHEEYFAVIWEFSSGISDSYDMTIRKIGHVLGWGSESHAIRHIGTGAKYQEITTITLYCILKHPNHYISTVKCAKNAPQNSVIITQIVAILMGVKLGVDAFPSS